MACWPEWVGLRSHTRKAAREERRAGKQGICQAWPCASLAYTLPGRSDEHRWTCGWPCSGKSKCGPVCNGAQRNETPAHSCCAVPKSGERTELGWFERNEPLFGTWPCVFCSNFQISFDNHFWGIPLSFCLFWYLIISPNSFIL